jgi:hypothetical protein
MGYRIMQFSERQAETMPGLPKKRIRAIITMTIDPRLLFVCL